MASDPSPIQNQLPPTAPGDEPRLTLLRTAATDRPLGEVASLVNLLNQTGESPSPGDEALRLAAVSRPVDEVHQLVTLLNEPPHPVDDAATTLRAAAMGRPIEEVAQLVAIFGPDKNGPDDNESDQNGPGRVESVAPAEAPRPPESGGQQAPEVRRFPSVDARHAPKAAAEAGTVSRGRAVSSSMRSALRWPAAVALLVIGAIHLPTDIAGLRAGDVAASVSLVVAVLCVVLACLLAAQDTVWIWAASAAAAVGTVALHSLAASFGTVHLLRDSLGNSFAGSTATALVCAVLAAVLAGSALLRRQKPQPVVKDA